MEEPWFSAWGGFFCPLPYISCFLFFLPNCPTSLLYTARGHFLPAGIDGSDTCQSCPGDGVREVARPLGPSTPWVWRKSSASAKEAACSLWQMMLTPGRIYWFPPFPCSRKKPTPTLRWQNHHKSIVNKPSASIVPRGRKSFSFVPHVKNEWPRHIEKRKQGWSEDPDQGSSKGPLKRWAIINFIWLGQTTKLNLLISACSKYTTV